MNWFLKISITETVTILKDVNPYSLAETFTVENDINVKLIYITKISLKSMVLNKSDRICISNCYSVYYLMVLSEIMDRRIKMNIQNVNNLLK